MWLLGAGTRRFGIRGIFAAAALLLWAVPAAHAVPGFARQTGLACEACHTVFPELTPFGRQFKLNAYVFSNVKQIQDINAQRQSTLSLSDLPPLSVMLMASNTTIGKSIPDSNPALHDLAQKNSTQFPQQLSLFYTGKITDNLGAFIQLTWEPDSGSIGLDNTDVRFADHGDFFGAGDLIYGVTLNNNPTSQDVWNSTPAWGYPFISTVASPSQIASPLIGGGIAQQAAGLSAYVYLWNHLYAELGAYRSVPNGTATPLDSGITGSNTLNISGVAPYWRAAWQQEWQKNSLSFGTFGLRADTHPAGVGFHGPTDTFTDIGFDAQYQWIGEDHIFSAYATYIHEILELDATLGGTKHSNTLDSVRLTGNYFYHRKYGASVSFFSTTGSSDPLLYAPAAVTGSNNGSPDTQGATFELVYLPWLNTKLGLQYTAYTKFNGSTSNYDGFGRKASDNNTLFVYLWTSF